LNLRGLEPFLGTKSGVKLRIRGWCRGENTVRTLIESIEWNPIPDFSNVMYQ